MSSLTVSLCAKLRRFESCKSLHIAGQCLHAIDYGIHRNGCFGCISLDLPIQQRLLLAWNTLARRVAGHVVVSSNASRKLPSQIRSRKKSQRKSDAEGAVSHGRTSGRFSTLPSISGAFA